MKIIQEILDEEYAYGAHTRWSRQMRYYNFYIYILYIRTINHDKGFAFKTVPFP